MTTSDNIVNFYPKDQIFYAKCPGCGSIDWQLRINGITVWDSILGSECSDCGFFVDWILAVKNDDEDTKEESNE
jgi:hypothetical protein